MLDLRQGFAGNHSSRINDSYDSSSNIDLGIWARRTAQNYQNYGKEGSSGIDFGSQTQIEDESGNSSPPLWKASSPSSPTEASPLNPRHNHHHYHLSPASRSQAIARGRRELMEMIQNMPESNYELSLKDLVEQPIMPGVQQATVDEDGILNIDAKMQGDKGRRNIKKSDKKRQIMRNGSMDSGVFLLKMFFPTRMGSKKKNKKNSATGSCSKVSPKPQSLEGPEKGVDKEWWKKRLSVAGEGNYGGSSSNSGSKGSTSSSGSSSSRNSSRSRYFLNCLESKILYT
uniref:Uncharacterized protein n=1 Tax=Nelumbo nucifera TaxID=4432 RepID=A0A822XSM6_NELNU|nr:TPA_asm: hypothetical protein HUJ06_024166 [Nelumbo nucifera]